MRIRRGFTLIELLVALFIFTILSFLLSMGLRSVLDAHARTEKHSSLLRDLEMMDLVLSRDIAQMVHRPVLDESNKEKPAFRGMNTGIGFTIGGQMRLTRAGHQSDLSHIAYAFHDQAIWRSTWDVLDLAPGSKAKSVRLLTGIKRVEWGFLNQENHFQSDWVMDFKQRALPKAVKIKITFLNDDTWQRLYEVPIESTDEVNEPKKS